MNRVLRKQLEQAPDPLRERLRKSSGRHHRVKRSELDAFMASVCDGSPTVDMDARAAELASA
jgi:hypothetical protein